MSIKVSGHHLSASPGFSVDERELVLRMLEAGFGISRAQAEKTHPDSDVYVGMQRAGRAALSLFCECMTEWGVGDEGKPN